MEEPITVISKNKLKVRTDKGVEIVTIKDIIEYYVSQAGSMSGYRELGTIGGDWRMIDYIAQDVLETFKEINLKGLRAEAKRRGLEPKF